MKESRRDFVRHAGTVLLAGSAPLAGCMQRMPASAIAAWQGPRDEVDVRLWILGYAILAPHSHNLQSWKVDLSRSNEILLRCDLARLLPQTDPFSRQIMMSHGTFIEVLHMAACERGLRADVQLFPEGEFGSAGPDGRLVARIRLRPDGAVPKDPLFTQILRRRTNRNAYDLQRGVPADAWQAMEDAVRPHPFRFGFAGAGDAALLARHRAIAAEAWRIELTTPRTVLESYRVLRVGSAEIEQHRDGLFVLDPVAILAAWAGVLDRTKAPAADAYATTSQLKDFNRKLDATPAFLWLVTQDNSRSTQVNAGRAYVRVQLEATARGLAMQPLQQALEEYPEQAGPLAAIRQLIAATSPVSTVQMWARVGYAPPIGPSPRRGVAAQLV